MSALAIVFASSLGAVGLVLYLGSIVYAGLCSVDGRGSMLLAAIAFLSGFLASIAAFTLLAVGLES